MALTNTSYRYEYGVLISEAGLNKISRALRMKRPNLFSTRNNIPIKAAVGSQQEHTLAMYALIRKESLLFDIYPMEQPPQGKEDTISVTLGLDFSLTDNLLGFITKIGLAIKATISVIRTEKLQVSLIDFEIIEVRGEQPQFILPLVNGVLDASQRLTTVYKLADSKDKQLVDTLTAVVNYLIDVFLKDALSKAVTNFPVPDISNIIRFGKVVFSKDELRGPFLRNNGFYTMLGRDLTKPLDFPAEPGSGADIRVGISKSGLDRIATGMLPYKIPDADITKPYNTFYIHAYNMQVERASFDLTPGDDQLGLKSFFSGIFQVDIQFNVPVINKHIDIPIPIPFDKLSHYSGGVTPYLRIDPITAPDAKVHVNLLPVKNFFEAWYIFVLTDYRDYFVTVIRDWVSKFKDIFIIKFLKHIPIIGWIIGKAIDISADVLTYITGAILDIAVSTSLDLLINSFGRALATILTLDFDVYDLPQKLMNDATGLYISSGAIGVVDDGRDGELELKLLFDSSLPPMVVQTQLDPIVPQAHPEKPPFSISGISALKEYPLTEFNPALILPPVSFQQISERFSITSKIEADSYAGFFSLSFYKNGDSWTLQKSMDIPYSGNETATLVYDNNNEAVHLDLNTSALNGTNYHMTVDNDIKSKISTVNILINDQTNTTQTTGFYPTVSFEFSEFWIYRLAFTDISKLTTGKFSRLSVKSCYEYSNWARIIPVEIKSITDAMAEIPSKDPGKAPFRISCSKVICVDEDGNYELMIIKSGGLFSATFGKGDSYVTINSI
jgi:hypothetical protein